jgi:hypothetical protein
MENNTQKEWVKPEITEFEVLGGKTLLSTEDFAYHLS